jgi:hypothetical protein
MKIADISRRWTLPLFIPLLLVAVFYLPGFGGFWLGDDFPNLHRAYVLQQQGELWSDVLRLFANPVPSQGAFYRPMMMLSLTLNYAAFDAHYSGWYALNFLVHLANTILVACLVRRLAALCDCDGRLAGIIAAVWFGLSPAIAEGVFWVSARADGWVTLLSFLGVYIWVGRDGKRAPASALALPILLVAALGFKESAAVLPLQAALIFFASPKRFTRSHRMALFACFLIVLGFLGWRAHLFGNAWHVYTPDPQASGFDLARLWVTLHSIRAWWLGLTQATPLSAFVYAMALAGAITILSLNSRGSQAKMVLAFGAASGGLAIATLLNLGAMSATGEGGRLTYGPVAWLALALGVAMSLPKQGRAGSLFFQRSGAALTLVSASIGAFVLYSQLQTVWAEQQSIRSLAAALPAWKHNGMALLMIPDREGAVIWGRNAQGGLVWPPIQAQPLLHRVLPTLPGKLELRYDQLARGLGQRIIDKQPPYWTHGLLEELERPAKPYWPETFACWSSSQRQLVRLENIDHSSRDAWVKSMRAGMASCGL